MPITIRRRGAAPTPESEGPSTLQRILAGGARVGAGVLATPVGMVPSPMTTSAAGAIGMLGELLAQRLEGSDPNFKRALVEGGIAAVPFGKLVKGGRALQSAVRSGALSGVGEAGRELSMGEDISPTSVGLAGILGGVTGGILGKITPPVLQGAEMAAPKVAPPTPRATGRLTRGGELVKEAQVPLSDLPKVTHDPSPALLQDLLTRNISKLKPSPAATPGAIEDLDTGIMQAGKVGQKIRGEVLDDLVAEYRAAEQAGKLLGSDARASNKAFGEMLSDRAAADAKAGLKPGTPRVSESFSSTEDGVTTRVNTPFKKPKADDALDDADDTLDDFMTPGGGPTPINPVTPPEPIRLTADVRAVLRKKGVPIPAIEQLERELADSATAEETQAALRQFLTPAAEASPSNLLREGSEATGPVFGGMQIAGVSAEDPRELAQLFKSRVGATGKNYRVAKQAAEAGEIPTADFARAAHLREQAALKGEAPPVATPDVPQATPSWVEEQTKIVDELLANKAKGGDGPVIGSGLGGLQGILGIIQRHPEFAAKLGLAAAGATVGGVTDPLDNPLASMALGGAFGAASPEIISALGGLGIPKGAIPSVFQKAQTPEGVAEVVRTVGRNLPQYQRFNYLADLTGLPANILVGPYGSAVMGALTKALSGDTRGWAALQELRNPVRFIDGVLKAKEEAIALIKSGEASRGETELLGNIGDPRTNPLTWPGIGMTSGDLAARRILMRAGFTEDEARVMTMTSEPELPAMRGVAELGKRSPFLQFLMPFRRTPANIAEQGAHRIPGLGLLTQQMRKTADPWREQAVQQGVGAAFGAGGYLAGESMDPETARQVRRYLTNASGQYSLPTALGLAAGQASRQGQPLLSMGTARAVDQALPLPSAEPLMDIITGLGRGQVPRGFIPSDLHRMLYPPETSGVSLRPITIRRRQ